MSKLFFAVDPIPKLNAPSLGVPQLDPGAALHNGLNTAYTWAGIICVIIIIVAGFMYVTSSGDAAKVKKAKDAILGAVIGIIVILMAFAITAFVMGRL